MLTSIQDSSNWRYVFFICAVIYVIGMIIFLVIGSGEDRLNVLVRQPASQNDDDLDASFAADGSATWFANVRDAAPVGYITEANHDHTLHDVYDAHALFG